MRALRLINEDTAADIEMNQILPSATDLRSYIMQVLRRAGKNCCNAVNAKNAGGINRPAPVPGGDKRSSLSGSPRASPVSRPLSRGNTQDRMGAQNRQQSRDGRAPPLPPGRVTHPTVGSSSPLSAVGKSQAKPKAKSAGKVQAKPKAKGRAKAKPKPLPAGKVQPRKRKATDTIENKPAKMKL